jgi:hypothetical protein
VLGRTRHSPKLNDCGWVQWRTIRRATFGVLNLLVMYAATNYAAVRHLWSIRPWSAMLPDLGVVLAGYVLVRNAWPPQGPHEYLTAQRVTAPPLGETARYAPVAAAAHRSC